MPDTPTVEVLPALVPRGGMDQVTRGEIDCQVATAKSFPRSIEAFRKKALGMATIDEETAASCYYKLPRDGKTLEGPSVRLAEIVASAYGNLRVQGRVVSEDERNVTLAGGAWDIENNVLYSVEVRRRITKKDGSRYSDDMINTTANAGISIAVRNALFRAVPHTYTKEILEECKKVARGTASTLSARREKALAWFKDAGVEASRVFAGIGVRGIEDITIEHIETLQGIRTAIREGELTAETAFAEAVIQTRVDPIALAMQDLGCTEDQATTLIFQWNAMRTPEAARVVQMKQYKGRFADLAEMLASMGAPDRPREQAKPAEAAPPPPRARKPRTTAAPPPPEDSGKSSGESLVAELDKGPVQSDEDKQIDAEAAQQETVPAKAKSGGRFSF